VKAQFFVNVCCGLSGEFPDPEILLFVFYRMPSTELVFVYGTLRKGGKYNAALRDAIFLGSAQTQEQYALYRAEYARLVKQESVSPITGEVYQVNPSTLSYLDEIEEHPDVYCREQVQVILENGQQVWAWVYFYPQPIGILEPSGDYAQHLQTTATE
jgi:gamma-glutamylaminecyclotransferase